MIFIWQHNRIVIWKICLDIYIWKNEKNIQTNFSSKFPLDVTESALINSSNSIEPSFSDKSDNKNEKIHSFAIQFKNIKLYCYLKAEIKKKTLIDCLKWWLIMIEYLLPNQSINQSKLCLIKKNEKTKLTLFSSNTRNTSEANFDGSPCGKNCL
mgnify:CR=1 FL=1